MNTQATHTPAPWSVSIERDKYDSSRDLIRVRAEEDRNHPQGPLTVSQVNHYLRDESVANAHLIAAAPDLLAALSRLAVWTDHLGPCFCQACDYMPGRPERHKHSAECDIARAAIAKAEGAQ
jgi:hypothetical protein